MRGPTALGHRRVEPPRSTGIRWPSRWASGDRTPTTCPASSWACHQLNVKLRYNAFPLFRFRVRCEGVETARPATCGGRVGPFAGGSVAACPCSEADSQSRGAPSEEGSWDQHAQRGGSTFIKRHPSYRVTVRVQARSSLVAGVALAALGAIVSSVGIASWTLYYWGFPHIASTATGQLVLGSAIFLGGVVVMGLGFYLIEHSRERRGMTHVGPPTLPRA